MQWKVALPNVKPRKRCRVKKPVGKTRNASDEENDASDNANDAPDNANDVPDNANDAPDNLNDASNSRQDTLDEMIHDELFLLDNTQLPQLEPEPAENRIAEDHDPIPIPMSNNSSPCSVPPSPIRHLPTITLYSGVFTADPDEIDRDFGEADEEGHEEEFLDPEQENDDLQPDPETPCPRPGTSGKARQAPTVVIALESLECIDTLLFVPQAANQRQRRIPTKLAGWSPTYDKWTESLIAAAAALKRARKTNSRYGSARSIRDRARTFIETRKIPASSFGAWAKKKMETHPELAEALIEHCVGVGPYVQAKDLVEFMSRPEIQVQHNLPSTISIATAKRWMHALKFRWVRNHKGQYVDGHEREDVVQYRQAVFIPEWYKLEDRMRSWTGPEMNELETVTNGIHGASMQINSKRVVVWFHDESMFYAHDRRLARWVQDGASPTPYAKGEGVSLMVADLVSADYGWLRSRDGKRSARAVFKPGKNRDGYFTNTEILEQARNAMEILASDYPDEEHVLVFDNATTHCKRPDDAISARKMPKCTPAEGKNWGVSILARDEHGKEVLDKNQKPVMVTIPMAPGKFPDGSPHHFYFPPGHPRAGIFKGMAVILAERGIDLQYTCPKTGSQKTLLAQCNGFKFARRSRRFMHAYKVTPTSLAYICLGGFIVALYINEVILGTAFGIIVGPHCANIFDPRSWGPSTNAITLEVMRVILATGLFAIGVELPGSYMKRHARGLAVLVVPTMALGWLTISAIMYLIFPNLAFISCLAVTACLTPTDPIICATIVGGSWALKHVPRNLRLLISAESAANDGLAYPFLSISIYLTVEASRKVAIGKWFLVGWLYEVILGIVLGSIMGLSFSYLMKVSHRRGFIDRQSYIAQYLALALFTTGVASTIGSDDLLAAFACGNAISWDQHFNEITENEVFSSVIDLVLNCGCFVYIALRRIPVVLLLYRFVPEIKTWKEALFTGHFGPMGVGAVFVSTLAVSRLPQPNNPPADQQELLAATLQPIVAFVVLGSIIVHGLSIPFFTLSGNMQSRTRSLMVTLSRHDTVDWLIGARRDRPALPTRGDGDLSQTATVIGIVTGQAGLPQDTSEPNNEQPRITTSQ
ncbi:unnamed protein product [Mycena citricolor]|uniref:Cation/H+ exchanger transmembrane domain-containing protein n=1 Tax=Mycena citricolor TaxID=2018698 RepID=A0AAD2Q0W0_9AGAR|nr:unnamed protein product [Mycena citricolor]